MRYNRRTETSNTIHQQAPDLQTLRRPVRAAGAFGGTMTTLSHIVARSVCALALAAPPALAAEQFINVLTGGTSGVYYPLGVALAGSIGKAIPGAKTSVQATKASVENLNLLQAG